MNKNFSELCETLGEENAKQLVYKIGGAKLYVPRVIDKHHRLSKLLGNNLARLLCANFHSQELRVPKMTEIRTPRLVTLLYQMGIPIDEISWLANIKKRHVLRILDKPERRL